jgi:hypothetical protein
MKAEHPNTVDLRASTTSKMATQQRIREEKLLAISD